MKLRAKWVLCYETLTMEQTALISWDSDSIVEVPQPIMENIEPKNEASEMISTCKLDFDWWNQVACN